MNIDEQVQGFTKGALPEHPSEPHDVLQPRADLWDRLAARIAPSGTEPLSAGEHMAPVIWEEVAPGIRCKVLAANFNSDRVTLLVRLDPGHDYPPHEHAEAEELHLLDGELWINERKLLPGDYHRAEAGSADRHVWSETGCTCVLITSLRDRLTERHTP